MREDSALRDEGFGGNSVFSRRRLFGMSAAVGLGAVGIGRSAERGAYRAMPLGGTAPGPASGRLVGAPRPEGVLGANFNGDPRVMSFPELQDIKATWVRGFFAMPDADQGNPADQPAIRALLTAADQGYGTVLSLQFPYFHESVPTPGTPAMADAQRRLDAVLPVVMNRVDILAIGNEPFIECEGKDRSSDRLNVFYESIAQRAIAHRSVHFGAGGQTQLFMGGLNHLDLPEWRTPATDRWMRFVRSTPSLAGTDIHPHLPDPSTARARRPDRARRRARDRRRGANRCSGAGSRPRQ